VRPTDI